MPIPSWSIRAWSVRLPALVVAMLASVPAFAAESFGDGVAEVARSYRDERPPLRIEACNGLIEDVLRDAGVDMRGNVRTLFATMKERGWVHRNKVPRAGDVVFFDRTYDSNGNGRQDDALSHIALVISVDSDATVHMVHRGSKGIRPLTMNLKDPSARRDEAGKVLNSWLGQPGYAKEGAKMAGELWRAFATPQGDVPSVAELAPEERVSVAIARVEPSTRAATEAEPERILSLTDEGFVRAWEGRRLRESHLAGRSCLDLWYLRNTLFARHGYSFRGGDARRAFSAVPAYDANPSVTASTADAVLTRRDRKNLEAIQALETRYCRK